jgi:hypothetical protein
VYNGLQDSASVTVAPATYPRLIFVPSFLHTMAAGDANPVNSFRAYLKSDLITTEEVTDRAVWASSNTQVATVANGRVTGIGFGSAAVSGTFNGLSVRSTVYVQARVDSIAYLGGTITGTRVGATATYTGTVNCVLVSAPTGTVRFVVVDQTGKIISPGPEQTSPLSASALITQTYTFVVPAGTTQLCGRWMLVPDGGPPKFADAPCTPIV